MPSLEQHHCGPANEFATGPKRFVDLGNWFFPDRYWTEFHQAVLRHTGINVEQCSYISCMRVFAVGRSNVQARAAAKTYLCALNDFSSFLK